MVNYCMDTLERVLNDLDLSSMQIRELETVAFIKKSLHDYIENCKNNGEQLKLSDFIMGKHLSFGVNTIYGLSHARARLMLEKLFPTITNKGFGLLSDFDFNYENFKGKDVQLFECEINRKPSTKKNVDKFIRNSRVEELSKFFRNKDNFCDYSNLIAFLDLECLKKISPFLIELIEEDIKETSDHRGARLKIIKQDLITIFSGYENCMQ